MQKKLQCIVLLVLSCFMLFTLCACEQEIAVGEELIKNGDFSSVNGTKLTNWTSSNYHNSQTFIVQAESTGDEGYCAHLNASTVNDARIEQTISVAPNAFYRITCRVKTKGIAEGAGANVSVLLSVAKSTGVFGDSDWQTLTLVGRTGSDQKELTVALRIGGYSAESYGEAWFDDVSVMRINAVDAGAAYSDFSVVIGNSSNDDSNKTEAELSEAKAEKATDAYAKMLVGTLALGFIFAVLYYRIIKPKEELMPVRGDNPTRILIGALALGFIIRVLLSVVLTGHSTDIACFSSWSSVVARVGFADFYTSISFCDYPPGYMAILWIVGTINNVFQLESSSWLYYVVLKLPTIIADLAVSYLIFKFASKRFPKRITYLLLFITVLNPAFMFLSGGWGQIDQLLTLSLLASMLLLIDDKPIWAGVLYGVAMLIKPQAFLVGPVIFVAYMLYIRSKDAKNRFGLTPVGYLLGLIGVGAIILLGQSAGSIGLYIMIACAALAVIAFVYDFIVSKDERRTALLKTHAAVVSALVLVVAVCTLFKGNQPFDWFLDKYIGTSSSYPYATIEAYNLFGLIGANWASSTGPVTIALGEASISLGISYETLGTIFIVASCVYAIVLYFVGNKRNKHALLLAAAFLIASIFTLGHFMHERYLFPALTFMLFAFVFYNDKRILISFMIFSCSLLLNSMGAMFVVEDSYYRIELYKSLVFLGSLLTMIGYGYFVYACTDILLRGRYKPVMSTKRIGEVMKEEEALSKMSSEDYKKLELEKIDKPSIKILPPPTDTKINLTKRDRLYIIILTVVYAVIALTNLGSTQGPESYEIFNRGESFNITFEQDVVVSDIRIYTGLETSGKSEVGFVYSTGNSASLSVENGNMFRWTSVSKPNVSMSGCNVTIVSGSAWILELAFFDEDGAYIPYSVDVDKASVINDEPDEVPDTPSYMNGMYFDELYHARTAYEHLNGLIPYEISHPPLGKIIISAGIAVFGMNAFGWRVSGAVLGILMLPILYFFAKRLFKRSDLALFAAGLFAFDFMHFTQTRIATIDVYSVFFTLLMYYYMYQYFRMNFHVDGLKKTLKPLALAGLFFGCGAASKWTGIYAGVGLAVILAVSLYRRWDEYYKAKKYGTKEEKRLVDNCGKNTIKTLLWCCVFFIAVPVVIYVLSYIPYITVEGAQGIWENQKYMLSYHTGLTAGHDFASSWYAWPFTVRPVWYYQSKYNAAGYTGTIAAFGNPAVWWICTIATVILLFLIFTKRIEIKKGMTVIVAGLCANYLPWVLVTRCTFMYHFFNSVPFIILGSTYLIKHIEDKYAEKFKWVLSAKWIWLAVAIVLFAVFYPVLTGISTPSSYVHSLEWFPTWYFTSVK